MIDTINISPVLCTFWKREINVINVIHIIPVLTTIKNAEKRGIVKNVNSFLCFCGLGGSPIVPEKLT